MAVNCYLDILIGTMNWPYFTLRKNYYICFNNEYYFFTVSEHFLHCLNLSILVDLLIVL
jgi:hypothetical protein